MAQQIAKNKPYYVVTDKSPKFLTGEEALYLKNYRLTFNANGASKEGGNFGIATPNRGNKKFALITLPAGTNVNVSSFECEETKEFYFANWNSNNLHGWYRINANMVPEIIIIDPHLNFSIDPAFKISKHRVSITPIYEQISGAGKIIREKILTYTDGNIWQKFINVEAAIKTNGFDAVKYPYWALRGPHFDRDEFIDLAVRPPMNAPIATPMPVKSTDIELPNNIIDKNLQFGYKFILTDRRPSTVSPYSNPVVQKSSPCSANNSNVPRGYNIVMDVGSAMVEAIQLFQKECGGDWYLYDTILRFGETIQNDEYWLRTGDWNNYRYDPLSNTITYQYFGDKETGIIDQDDFNSFQTDLPILSVGASPAGDSLLLADNLYGYNNLPVVDVAKFIPSVIDKSVTTGLLKTQKITLYAYLAQNAGNNQFLYTVASDTPRFGGLNMAYKSGHFFDIQLDTLSADYLGLAIQSVGGFVAYLAGTDYSAVGQQYVVNPDGTMILQGIINMNSNDQKSFVIDLFKRGGYIIQKFDFVVPAGRYIARLARHGVGLDTEYQKTSTFVLGQASKSKIKNFNGIQNYRWGNEDLDSRLKELEVDVCNGDFDAWTQPDKNLFYIFVPYVAVTFPEPNEKDWRFVEGYIWEDEVSKVPAERLFYQRGNPGGTLKYYRYGENSDHNGHYFVYMGGTDAFKAEVIIFGVVDCASYQQIATTKINKTKPSDFGYYPNTNVSIKDNHGGYGDCNRVLIQGQIIDSVTGFGYSGISITSTSGASTSTSTDGTFTLIVHDGKDYNRTDKLYINGGGNNSCFVLPVTGACFEPIIYHLGLVPCHYCSQRIYPQNFIIPVKLLSQNANDLKDGGAYRPSFHLMDLAGRTTYEQELNIVDIPTFMEKGGIVLSRIQIQLKEDVIVDPALKWLIFSRTTNLKIRKYLQWVGDQIEFLDKNGDVVPTGAGAIRARITIQSLLDYNTENNFTVNANYQFTVGDVLRFYDDGNGNLFDPAVVGIMDYPILGTDFNDTVQGSTSVATSDGDTTTTVTTQTNNNEKNGKTLIIAFDKRLLVLNNIIGTNTDNIQNGCGFWIELQTPRQSSQIDGFCEVVGTYPVINGVIKAGTYILDTFDTYYQTRDIHIKQCTGKAILHPFASMSASDYFTSGCDSCGRKLVKNDLARQQWVNGDVIKSDELINQGFFINGLGRFRATSRRQYKGTELGGLVAIHARNKLVAFICENDWFIADYDTNFVQVAPGGLISATFNDILGEPQTKVRYKQGCSYEDTDSIVINDKDGYIMWIDDKNQDVIVMDYRSATAISDIDNKSYFSNKLTYIRKYNESLSPADRLTHYFDKVLVYDYKFKEIHVSFRPRRNLITDPQFFTNTEREIAIPLPETFTFSLEQKKWTQFQTFVAESYGAFRTAASGSELISFMGGVPYLHNSIDNNNFNQFFGVDDNQVIEIAFNNPEERGQRETNKELTFQAVIIDAATIGYFIDLIKTNNPNLFSYLPISWIKKKKNIFYGSLLLNMASYPDANNPTGSMLYDGGGKISGQYCILRFVRDLSQLNSYSEVDNFYMQYIGLEKSK